MVPGIIGSSMAQVSLLLDTLIASFLVTGSVAWLYFADRLMEFPLGVFSIALGDRDPAGPVGAPRPGCRARASRQTLDWALRLTVLLVAPAAVGMLCLCRAADGDLLRLRPLRAADVQMASYALMAYSWGLLGFSLVKVLAPGYFARQDTRTTGARRLHPWACNMALNVLVVLPAAKLGFPAPHVLLATSTCIGAAAQHGPALARPAHGRRAAPSPVWREVPAAGAAGQRRDGVALSWLAGDIVRTGLSWGTWQRVVRCCGGIIAGAGVYFAVLYAAGLRYRDLRPGVR